jgi:Ni,Fe-hydrogenase III large subunit
MSTAPDTDPRGGELAARIAAAHEDGPAPEVRLVVGPDRFADAACELKDAGARFVTVFVAHTPPRMLTAVLALHGQLLLLRAPLTAHAQLSAAAIGEWWPAARWAERELLGTELGDVRPEARLTAPDADLLQPTVTGLDVFTIPYGPVRSGIFEAIQFQIETGGEDVTRLQTRPFFKRRGIEARFAGLTPEVAGHVAERVAGIASSAYATAFSHAVERALGVTAPGRARGWRALYCELERIACHLDVIAKEAETTALYVGQARFQILKERIQRLRARLTGSRFGRGVIVPGGVRAEGMIGLDEVIAELDAFELDLARDRRLFLGTASMTDRLTGTGRLDRRVVEEAGAVGPLARGSGVSTDARHERPYGDYDRLGVRVVVRREGDAMARINVRFGELSESLRLSRQAIGHLHRRTDATRVPLATGASGAACGWAEAPQGELLIWVEVADGLIGRAHVASPSLRNWALFDHAFGKDVLTDFAFIEHSFGLTPAGADR